MVADFLLNSNGDIVFTETNKEDTFVKINFFKNNSKVVKLDFTTIRVEKMKNTDNFIKIDFDVIKKKNNKKTELVKENDFLVQRLNIELNTCLGELKYRKNNGSTISALIHNNLDVDITMKEIEKIVLSTLTKYDSNLTAEIDFLIDRIGTYKQNLVITIYRKDEFLLKKEMEMF